MDRAVERPHANALDPIARRIATRLEELAALGRAVNGGVTRLAYTREERRAHQLFARWAEVGGAAVECDAAGNTVATFADGDPYFLIGSHLDTVVDGGAYDGAAGVVGAFEVARLAVRDLRHGLRVVAFSAEEGARFGRPNLGSGAAAGLVDGDVLARLRDSEGVSALDAAAELGLRPHELEPWLGDALACFFEIHIEQGRQLELAAATVGLVDAIAGSIRLRLQIAGRPDHSGATPMHLRADALAAAAEIVLAAEEVARGYRSTVATVGRIEIRPNSVTTIAGTATLWVDIRDVDPEQQRIATKLLVDRAQTIAEARHVLLHAELISSQAPVVLDAWPRALARATCEQLGLPYRVMPSGAGHDAAIVARRAPSALIFVPCTGGVSHAPTENASPDDIAAAAQIVATVIARADGLIGY